MNSILSALKIRSTCAAPCLLLVPWVTHVQAQAEFQQLTASYQPISGYLAGNGIVTASTVPESSEWNPANEGANALAINLGNPHIAMADAYGNIYVAEKSNHSILKITPDGLAHTFAGTHVYPYTGPAPSYAPPAGFTTATPGPATSINLVACNGLYALPNGIVGSWQDDAVISSTTSSAHFSETMVSGSPQALYRLAAPR